MNLSEQGYLNPAQQIAAADLVIEAPLVAGLGYVVSGVRSCISTAASIRLWQFRLQERKT